MNILARHAHHLYWLACYFERATNMAVTMDKIFHLSLLLPESKRQLHWQTLLNIIDAKEGFNSQYTACEKLEIIQYLILDTENSKSLLSCLNKTRKNAQITRHLMPGRAWLAINQLWHESQQLREIDAVPTLLKECIASYRHFDSELYYGMARGDSFMYLQLGKYMERIDHVLRLIIVLKQVYSGMTKAVPDPEWNLLLEWFGLEQRYIASATTTKDMDALFQIITSTALSHLSVPKLFEKLYEASAFLPVDCSKYLEVVTKEMQRFTKEKRQEEGINIALRAQYHLLEMARFVDAELLGATV